MLLIRVMDLGVAKMGFIFCGKHPLLMARTQYKGMAFI